MPDISRRDFARLAGFGGVGALASPAWSPFAVAQGAAKVVIVGGGAGGATVAHYLKKEAPELDVTLIEANPIYSSSFFSNLYLGGLRTLESLNHTYGGLERLGVKVVHDTATDVASSARMVKTKGGRSYSYDRLVLSPGIEMKYDSIKGYSREASRIMPHAYTTAALGKRQLKQQLLAMRDGGTVAMVLPNNPYRCPPAPYERACMIAHYLKTRKPKSKLVILDPKKAFSKQAVMTEAFEKYYKDIIELNLSTEIDDYSVASLDPKTKEIVTQGRQAGEGGRGQRDPAAACRRDRGQGRMHRGRLVPDQRRQLRLPQGEGRLRVGGRGDCGGDAQVGVLCQQPGQGSGGRHPGRARQEGEVPRALPQFLLVAAGARRQRQDRRQLCAQGRQARFLGGVRVAAGRGR